MTGPQPPSDSSPNLHQHLDLDFALGAAGLGVWELNPLTNQVRWDERCGQLFGLDSTLTSYTDTLNHIHPEDVEKVNQAVQWALNPQSDGRYEMTYRSLGQDGHTRWIRSMGRSYFDPAGQPLRFAGIAQEVTQQIEVQQQEAIFRQQAQHQQRIYEAITASTPDLMYVFDLNYRFTYANQALLTMWGRSWDDSIGKGLRENGYEPWHAQMHEREIDQVVATKQAIRGEVSFPHATLGRRIYDYVFAPILNESGEVEAVAGTTRDITDIRQAQERIQEGQRNLLALFEQSPVGLATLTADDELVFEWANPFYGDLVARPPQALIGKPLLEALPELKGQGFDTLLKNVIATGTPFIAPEVAVNIRRDGQLTTSYVDLTYQPRKAEGGQVVGILVVATDVTQQVLSRKKIEESESKLRAIVTTAPAGIGLFVGRELVIENPNQTFIDIVGKGPLIEGLPLQEAMPELITEGQPFLKILDDVFTTGEPFLSPGALVKIEQNGVLRDNYYNISYSPVRNAAGEVYAILDIAIDVTQQVLAQHALKENQTYLQSVIDLAELGSYTIDVATNRITKSPRVAQWYGLPEETDVATSLGAVEAGDRERVSQVLAESLTPGSAGVYQVEYTVIHTSTGQPRILRTNGRVSWDEDGQPGRVDGTVMDITTQREVQVELERLVQQQTEEIAAANEELSTINEELTNQNEELSAINEVLNESTFQLERSNENLQRFAYVASHDLQEPLRKIQQFGDLLRDQYGPHLGEGIDYLHRMQSAASRMSILIKDLLAFSRLSTQPETSAPVALEDVVDRVLTTLEIAILETKAEVRVESLPTIQGDVVQLSQLFQNLLSNALKFHQPDVPPLIHIRSRWLAADHLPKGVNPLRNAIAYYQIEVADNGIGFEEKYLDRIFEVFQRLHTRRQYAGTGIGLAICEKVVANHGGAITASSQPGQGATFRVYLPV